MTSIYSVRFQKETLAQTDSGSDKLRCNQLFLRMVLLYNIFPNTSAQQHAEIDPMKAVRRYDLELALLGLAHAFASVPKNTPT